MYFFAISAIDIGTAHVAPDAADIYYVQPRPYSPVDTPGPLERGEDNPYLEQKERAFSTKSPTQERHQASKGEMKESATMKAMEKLRECLYKKHAAHLDCGRAARVGIDCLKVLPY